MQCLLILSIFCITSALRQRRCMDFTTSFEIPCKVALQQNEDENPNSNLQVSLQWPSNEYKSLKTRSNPPVISSIHRDCYGRYICTLSIMSKRKKRDDRFQSNGYMAENNFNQSQECAVGYEPNGISCAPCIPGTFSNNGTSCLPCPKDTYTPIERSEGCWPCPQGKVTTGSGANSQADCGLRSAVPTNKQDSYLSISKHGNMFIMVIVGVLIFITGLLMTFLYFTKRYNYEDEEVEEVEKFEENEEAEEIEPLKISNKKEHINLIVVSKDKVEETIKKLKALSVGTITKHYAEEFSKSSSSRSKLSERSSDFLVPKRNDLRKIYGPAKRNSAQLYQSSFF